MKIKVVRVATISLSLNVLLRGQLNFLNDLFKITAISSPGEQLSEVKKREKVDVYPIKIERKISPLKDIISLVKLYSYFKKEKPTIVHSITPKAGLLSMVAAKMAGVPIRIHTFTGLIFPSKSGLFRAILMYMDRLLCACATNIYPEGQGVKNDLINFNITNKPLNIISNGSINGINTEYFDDKMISLEQKDALRVDLGIKPTDFVYIFVGRLVTDKGINELVQAYKSLLTLCSDVKLLLVGSEETLLDPLKKDTIREIRDNPDILAVGYQLDVRPYFSISDVLVFPSYREGFPNVVLQAGAMGLPSIVTNINGCNEIIIHERNGIVVEPGNKDELLKAMKILRDNVTYYKNLKDNARRLIKHRYEQSFVWKAILDEYRNLCENV